MKFWTIFKRYWLKFSQILGIINTYIILSLCYFLVFPIFALIYFFIKPHCKAKTCWQKANSELDWNEQF